MRLDKYLADLRLGTRSELKQSIRKGRVSVDGVVVRDPAVAVSAESEVRYDGEALHYREHRYYLLNKPAGLLTATEDARQETVLDLFPERLRRGLSPVGRLDKDTVGLLLLTDDGALAHHLLAPRSHIDKVYLLRTDLPMDAADEKACAEGMLLADGTQLLPAELVISKQDAREARITIREGKYHQIKRMLAVRGKEVVYLKRLSMGGLELDPSLAEGEWRELTEEELGRLRGEPA